MIYACAECGAPAAEVVVDAGVVRREGHTGVLTMPVGEDLRARIAAALHDPAALFAIDPELAPFWCPRCAASYCGDHWRRALVFDRDPPPDWLDSIRGTCPAGHERMLED